MGVTGRGAIVAAAALLAVMGIASAKAGTVLFVVAERPGIETLHDSYVLPLSDPRDVAHARDLIDRGPDAVGGGIVFAEIAAGADGVNRNVLAPGEPLWNWHVSRFEGFGDIGIELTDGNPTQVGDDVQGWIENTRRSPDEQVGHIGFWSYTVVAELDDGPVTVPLPAALPAGAIALVAILVARRWPGAPWRDQ